MFCHLEVFLIYVFLYLVNTVKTLFDILFHLTFVCFKQKDRNNGFIPSPPPPPPPPPPLPSQKNKGPTKVLEQACYLSNFASS